VTGVQVQFTIDDRARGDAIATDLLERRLVACAQTVGPITSRYWWQGSITQSEEWLFLCKTTRDRVDAVIERIRASHPYDVPEIVACDITAGLGSYIDWITRETHDPPDTARS
jgi:periplasmic divalent cation tolerance protein